MRTVAIIAATVFALGSAGLSAFAAANLRAAADDSLTSASCLLSKTQGAEDGNNVLDGMLDRVKKLQGYVFESVLTTHDGTKTVQETGKLYFKAPNMIRFEVNKAENRSGAVVVRQKDGVIKGHMGGLLKGIKLTLSPDSKLLKTANGFSVLDSDLASLLTYAHKEVKEGAACLVGELPATTGKPHVMELVDKGGSVDERMLLDWAERMPQDWSIFHGDKLFSNVKFTNLQIRNDLPDSLFAFGGDEATKSLEPDSYQGNVDLRSLAASGGSLTASTMTEVADVIGMLRDKANELQMRPAYAKDGNGQGYVWSPDAVELLLLRAAEMEWLASDLSLMTKPIKKLETGSNAGALADEWAKSSKLTAEYAGRLTEAAISPTPNPAAISTALSGIIDEADKLEELRKRATDLL
jgi:outer membrane lipoprotein-sorting protein